MGGAQGKKLVKAYLDKEGRKGLTQSQNTRVVRAVFNHYDKDKKGWLTRREALLLIKHIVCLSGMKKTIEMEKPFGMSPEKYYQDVLEDLFNELDLNNNGAIEFEELMKPKFHTWKTLVEDVARERKVKAIKEKKKEREKEEESYSSIVRI